MAGTNRTDVVATFKRYHGRSPRKEDKATIDYLTKKTPTEVERLLSKDSPVTNGLLWKDYNKNATTSNIDPLKIAQSLGYTKQDFANDPGFVKYWENKSKAELEEALKRRGDFSKNSSRKRTASEQTSKNELDDFFANSGLTGTELEVLKNAVNGFDVNKIPSNADLEKMASDAETVARKEIDPYYRDLERRDMEDLKTGYADIRNEALRFQQQEAKSYKEELAKTKQSLRARGLTFSGRSRGVLGTEGALDSKGVEGELPQARRYNYEDMNARFQEDARDLGTKAERLYGSDKLYEQRDFLNPEGLPNPYKDGITYKRGRLTPVYNPKRKVNGTPQRGYVSRSQADIERQKERDIQRRISDRLKTKSYYN